MNDKVTYQAFDVKTVPLQGSNLIEASAGTGKTYSIAILVLRLLLEKQMPIQEILMVTFTKAAVAELEERIRRFVREAAKYAENIAIDDDLIKNLVDQAIEMQGEEKVLELLKSAVLNLDETSVLTIHSFCQQTLTEFAFETGQLFNVELAQDTSEIQNQEIQAFWRKYVTGIEADLLKYLVDNQLSQHEIGQVVQAELTGKSMMYYDATQKYSWNPAMEYEFNQQLQKEVDKRDILKAKVMEFIQSDAAFHEAVKSKSAFKNNFMELIDAPEQFLKKAMDVRKKGTLYIRSNDQLNALLDELEEFEKLIKKQIETILNELYSFAIQKITHGIRQQKTIRNLLSFDDLIENLHTALCKRNNPGLERELQKKYQAVFIDEFQDTDKLQYEIFEKAFHQKALLFYIGDPKQSIYAWRKADISTYFKARNKVDQVYEMNVNFRSTSGLIQAMNRFFLPQEAFDTFAFGASEERIDYHEVQAPPKDTKGKLTHEGVEETPISWQTFGKNDEIYEGLSFDVLNLLNDPKRMITDQKTKENRRILPSDIGVLVRKKSEAQAIKRYLSKLGIPAVTLDDAKILQSPEAKEILYVLDAMAQLSRAHLNRALLTKYIGWTTEAVQNSDEDLLLQQFRIYHEKWQKYGVYTALMNFISDFNVTENLLAKENGERTVTNLYHLLEILYKTENRQHFSPVELIHWLEINCQKNDATDDEMIQRVESDEDAVKITTIHSSKGLQYPIVFAPTLDFTFRSDSDRVYSFRTAEGSYRSGKIGQMSEEQFRDFLVQEEQENRRLLYVALTRAIYKCYIYHSTYYKNSTLATFLKALEVDGQGIAQKRNEENQQFTGRYVAAQVMAPKDLVAENFKLHQNNWLRMSYSGLAGQTEWQAKALFESAEDAYDQFVFKDLKKGAKTGNFLHFLFENLNFTKEETWERTMERAIKRFSSAEDEVFKAHLLTLLQQVLQTEISTENDVFSMADVQPYDCIHELEFDFPVGEFHPKALEKLREEGIAVNERYRGKLEGLMNGKVDLFFKNNGKYYVLDWKSNYLGPTIEDYSPENLALAMNDNNYHLQYLIYSFAVKKYLESRLGKSFNYVRDFGGVIYLFVRGMRKGENTGIFFAQPNYRQMKLMEFVLEKELQSFT